VISAALAAALPLALCGALQAALNLYRFGSAGEFGYGSEPVNGFTTPIVDGIGYLLLSPGKGLFVFAAPAIVGLVALPWLARRYFMEAAVIAGVFLIELLYFARWWAWHGDWSWGPRYLVVTLPFVMLGWVPLLARWPRTTWPVKGLASGLAVGGFVVALLGVGVDYGAYYSVVGNQLGLGVDVGHARLQPEFSPVLGHAWLLQASVFEALASGDGPDAATASRPNPFRDRYPWARSHPDLAPEAPERAFGLDLWFAALRNRTAFIEYWSSLVAWWLTLALLPLSRRLWRNVRSLA
jgi:hypothetical protein